MTIENIPGGQNMVTCSLETVNLADANPFFCLSYVWGLAVEADTILLNNQPLSIPKSLYCFLRELQARFCQSIHSKIRLWVDSICINQKDKAERGHQVSIMGDIYKGTDAVYAWLGHPSPARHDAMTCIERIRSMRTKDISWFQIEKELQPNISTIQALASSDYWT